MYPRSLPLDLKLQIVKDMGPAIDRPECCRVLVGALLHIDVGGRFFDIAGGPPNMYIVIYIHRVYK